MNVDETLVCLQAAARSGRGEHDLDAFGGEDRIEAAAALGVAVAEQEADAERGVVVRIHTRLRACCVTQVASGVALTPPRGSGGLYADECQGVHGLEEHRLDGGEVAGHDFLACAERN